MKESETLKNMGSVEEHSLGAIQYWLEYGKHSWVLGVAVYMLPYNIINAVINIAAYVFLPYMAWHLYKAKWYKSVVVLAIVVVLPFLASQFVSVNNGISSFMLIIIPYLTFFFFCYVISYMIGERIREIGTLRKWKREDRLRKS